MVVIIYTLYLSNIKEEDYKVLCRLITVRNIRLTRVKANFPLGVLENRLSVCSFTRPPMLSRMTKNRF